MNTMTPANQQAGLALMGVPVPDQQSAISVLLDGLPASGWESVADMLGVSDRQLAEAVGVSISTLTRRKREGRFTPEESDRLLRLATLASKAQQVFTSQGRLQAWFLAPNQQLAGATPLEYARTSIGASEVGRVLERILDGAPA